MDTEGCKFVSTYLYCNRTYIIAMLNSRCCIDMTSDSKHQDVTNITKSRNK